MTYPAVFDHVLLRQRQMRRIAGCDFLFQDTAALLHGRLALVKKEFPRILDLGCATGALSALLQERSGTCNVISVDRRQGTGVSVVVDAERLPFSPASFDAVLSCLDLQWVNDLPGTLLQIRHALKPDGVFMAALVGGESLKELRAALMEAELHVMGGASPRVSPFIDLRDMGALMQRAGFALPVTDADKIIVEYSDMFALMRDLRGMGATNVTFNRLRRPTRKAVFMEAAKIYHEKFKGEEGRITATFEIIHAIGWAPHASQPQPLRPGCAKTSLADVLTTE